MSLMKKLILIVLCVLLLASCSGSTVATVGNIKISKSEFEFYLASIKRQMSDTELQTDEDWQNKEIEGKKAIDVAKQQAMDNAVKNTLYIAAAEAAGITLTEDEEAIVQATKQQIVSGYGSENAYKEFLKTNNITDRFIEMMCRSSAYYTKVGEIVRKEASVTEEDKKTYFENNKGDFETDVRKAKHILIATIDPVTNQPKAQAEQEKASQLAKKIFDRVQKGEDFDKLMFEYSEDPGLESAPDGYVFGSGEMVAEFEQATDSVGFGEYAFCKSDFGYHIIKRLPISYEDVSEHVEDRIYGELIDEKIFAWKEEYGIEVVENENILEDIK